MTLLFIIAGVMAVCGIIGYRKGVWPTLIALGLLLVAVLIAQRSMAKVVQYLNGLFMGFMLVLKSGLTDLSTGNLESAKEKLESVAKPFTDSRTWLVMLLVLLGAVFIGWLLSRFIKSKPSIWGGLLGLLYGYVLSAAFVPLLFGFPPGSFPVLPFGDGGIFSSPTQPGTCTGLVNRFICFMQDPQNVQVCGILVPILIAILVIVGIRLSNRPAPKAATPPKKE